MSVGANRSASPAGERGQGTVELALLLPVVLVLALAVVQVGLVVHAQIQTAHAAREAARVVAVTGDLGAAREAAARAASLDPARLDVEVDGAVVRGGIVTVTVRYRAPTDVVLVGAATGDVGLVGRATMVVE
jgi:Flp pilus assembly protein TadG